MFRGGYADSNKEPELSSFKTLTRDVFEGIPKMFENVIFIFSRPK